MSWAKCGWLIAVLLCAKLAMGNARAQSTPSVKELQSSNQSYNVKLRTAQGNVGTADAFSLLIDISSNAKAVGCPTEFDFSAEMPAHYHGMPNPALVTRVGDCVYRVDHIRLHMPGVWRFKLMIRTGALIETAEYTVDIE